MSRHRSFLAALLALGALSSSRPARAAAEDLARARALDQQGVRAYREERYNDAIRFFEEARRLGGPPSETWNIAKCHLHMDETEEAAKGIEEYLAAPGLSANERAEAEQQLREVQRRHSTLTVASSPSGASVYLDGKRGAPAGITPATLDVAPGSHSVVIEHAGYEPLDRSVQARYGRAIIVDVQLARGDTPASPSAAERSEKGEKDRADRGASSAPHRLILEAEIGATLPRFGSIGGAAGIAGLVSASYVVVDSSRVVATVGARALLTSDSWSNTVGAPNTAANCGSALPSDESATAFGAFLDGGLAWRASPRWRIGGDLGLGVATYAASAVGGDLFVPSCRPAPGLKPAMHVGGEVSYALSRELRLVVAPILVEVHPAFDGTRSGPKDATGLWLRFGAAAGLAFDLF